MDKLRKQIKALKARLKALALKDDLSEEEAQELEEGRSELSGLEDQLEVLEEAEAEEAEEAEIVEAEIQERIEAEKQKALEEAGVELDDDGKVIDKNKEEEQPKAPGTGVDDPTKISVGSPYDHIDTLELAIGYQSMKAFGKQPSERIRRALAVRAAKMGEEEDTLSFKNGEPVKVPAIDPAYVKPARLGVDEEKEDGGDPVTPNGARTFKALSAMKANEVVYSTQANAGDEWVPTLMNAQLWRTIRLNAAVLALFEQFDMPSQPYDMPVESTDPTLYKVAETTAEASLVIDAGPYTDSKPGTGKVTFSAGKLGAISYWSDEQEEDGIIAPEPQFRDQYALKLAHGIDEALLFGDETTATTNVFDNGATNTTSHLLIVDGLIHEAQRTTTTDKRDGGVLTIDDFGATQALMGTAGKFGVNPNDLVWIMDPAAWHKAKLLGEVLTMDKMGALATILNGQLAAVFGAPIIISEDYGLTDANGVIHNTAGNNTKGSFICVNRRSVLVGWRRRPRIRVERKPFADAAYIVGSARFDIRYKEAGMVAQSYNLTV